MSHEIISELVASRGPVAIAFLTGARGSAPRHLGTMMLFKPDGSAIGTVGGGRVEMEATAAASKCLASGVSLGIQVEMTGTEAAGNTPICGGSVELSIEYVADPSMYSVAAAALERGSEVVLLLDIVPPGQSKLGSMLRGICSSTGELLWGEASSADRSRAADAVRSEVSVLLTEMVHACICIKPADTLLILGGGHVGRSLALFAGELGFRVFVGDERLEYTSPGRFPPKVATIQGTYRDIVERFDFSDSTFIVVTTPGHQTDLECLRAVMGRGYRYAGFIGSRRKTKMILEKLAEDGFDGTEIAALHAPIGIDIGAETPAEIAVSILAEIIAARRGSRSPAQGSEGKDRRQP